MQGVVHFSGLLGSPDDARAARVAAENVPDVRGVEDHRLNTVAQPWATGSSATRE